MSHKIPLGCQGEITHCPFCLLTLAQGIAQINLADYDGSGEMQLRWYAVQVFGSCGPPGPGAATRDPALAVAGKTVRVPARGATAFLPPAPAVTRVHPSRASVRAWRRNVVAPRGSVRGRRGSRFP